MKEDSNTFYLIKKGSTMLSINDSVILNLKIKHLFDLFNN
jgi:hypothetical protein